MKENIQSALNEQLNVEFYSSYYYLAMSTYFHAVDLNGFAAWMRAQAQEELSHAMKIYDFMNDREVDILLKSVASPQAGWESPLAAFTDALQHEREVTEKIYTIVDLSLEGRDHATNTFMQWFVTEQVEEEATAKEIVQQLKLVGGDGNGMFLMDRELGQRTAASGSEAGATPGQ